MAFSISDPVQKQALANEINTDPVGYGYAAHVASGNDQAIASILNKVRDGTDGFPAIAIKRGDVTGAEVFHAISIGDLVNNPGGTQLEYINALFHAPFLIRLLNDDGTATPVRENVISVVKSGTTTLQRLAALEARAGSRGEQLWGGQSFISHNDVAIALRG